jgi:TusA-related sulfurtransferase/DNA-binding transcriptional ArsR family regulator
MDPATREIAHRQASLCRVFGNSRRILIVWALRKQELSVGDIALAVDTSLQNISQHLRLMKDKGILESRRDGSYIYYRLADNKLTRNCPILLGVERTNIFQDISIQNYERRNTMNDLNSIAAAKVVDARAMACPGPLLEAKKSIGGVKIGEVLEIWTGDANTKNDMPNWCQKVGHEYLGELDADGYERLFIRRKK